MTFVSAGLSGRIFAMTLMSCNEHGNLRQVNVRVEIVNQPKGNWGICSMTGGD